MYKRQNPGLTAGVFFIVNLLRLHLEHTYFEILFNRCVVGGVDAF